MDFKEKLDELLTGCDMRSELDRRRTYMKCVEYGESMIDADHLSEFLRQAAERLGQQRLFRENTSDLVKSDGKEKIHIRFDEGEGIQLVANQSGLLYLSRILKNLSLDKEPGEYVYFYYGEDPLTPASLPLAVYREDDAYFEDLDEDEDEYDGEEDGEDALPAQTVREVDPAEVAGFFVLAQPPVEFGIRPMKVYPVREWIDLPLDHMVLDDDIGRDIKRMVIFTFNKDDGTEAHIALDMGDPGVGFLTREDLRLLTTDEGR
ncbi:MAG: hypothetical protein PHD32_05690 [Eubacteriales bacterium]|nr:hypothetical protein [Eubacteriales bacterium]